LTTTLQEAAPPRESYLQLFLRFLRFGFLAWGGPVAQIAMIRQELVEEERWITRERFNRTLAIYQALPGPEAHELCVYFGVVARGRLGGILAGLGFMLPGLLLMLLLSWLYVQFGLTSPLIAAVFAGFQAAVVALVVRAVHRIGGHALHDRWLWTIAAFALVGELLGVHFALTLICAGIAYFLVKRGWPLAAVLIGIVFLAAVGVSTILLPGSGSAPAGAASNAPQADPSVLTLLLAGLRAGLLTFGGAYTAIPFLRNDAVEVGGWMTGAQFLDGIALGGILPAPLIIFGTFVGYIGGGLTGALIITAGIFLPAFSFTLIGHELLERLIERPRVQTMLDGITAGVVGIIAATTVSLFRSGITSIAAAAIFGLSLFALYIWKAKSSVAGVVLGAGLLGLLFFS